MPEAPAVDPMLQLFVRLMNNLDVQLGVTVLVGGSWVSGILIPPRTFTEESGAELVEKAGAEAEGLQVFFRELGRHWFPSDEELEAETAGRHRPQARRPALPPAPAQGPAGDHHRHDPHRRRLHAHPPGRHRRTG